jgi:hypothetical protein
MGVCILCLYSISGGVASGCVPGRVSGFVIVLMFVDVLPVDVYPGEFRDFGFVVVLMFVDVLPVDVYPGEFRDFGFVIVLMFVDVLVLAKKNGKWVDRSYWVYLGSLMVWREVGQGGSKGELHPGILVCRNQGPG